MDAALCNQLMTEFEDNLLFPIKHTFTGYLEILNLQHIGHFYGIYAWITNMELAEIFPNYEREITTASRSRASIRVSKSASTMQQQQVSPSPKDRSPKLRMALSQKKYNPKKTV